MDKDKKGKYVPIYLDWLDVTQDLTADEKGNLIDAVVSYAAGVEYEHFLSGGVRIAFRFLKGQVDRNREISDIRSEARRNKQEQNATKDNKTDQTESKLPKEKEKEKEKEKKYFIPPTLDEVAAYCKERNNGIDPQYFLDYQTARDWVLSNGKKCKDWKATIRTWEKNGYNRRKTVVAQTYEQRSYEDEDAQAMRRMLEGVTA